MGSRVWIQTTTEALPDERRLGEKLLPRSRLYFRRLG